MYIGHSIYAFKFRKEVRALRGLFGRLRSQNLKVASDWFIRRITQVYNSGINLNFNGCYGHKNGRQNRLKIEKSS